MFDASQRFVPTRRDFHDAAQEKPQHATVVSVGRGRLDDDENTIPLDVKVGDVVLIGKYAGTEIKMNGEE